MISLENISFSYGSRKVLDGISFSANDGEFVAVLGANGAGKSTTIKIILGLPRQNSGKCLLFGKEMARQTRKDIGYLPESPYFYKFLTGFELVVFYAKLCGMSNNSAKNAAMKALNLVGLDDAANRQIALYSKGMVQRAGLAQAIVHNPRLLILDEPASGLDPIGASDMADIILRLKAEGKTVLLCSHMMSEVEKLCSRAAILSKGKIAAMGKLDDMLSISGTSRIELKNAGASQLESIRNYAESLGVEVSKAECAKIPLDDFFRKVILK